MPPKINAVVALHVQGHVREAEAGYRALIDAGRAPIIAFNNLAAICAASARADEAAALLRQAIDRDPDFADSYHNLGALLQQQNRIDEAITAFRSVVRLTPDSARAHYHVGLALALRDNSDRNESIACFRHAISLDCNHALAHHNLGVALRERGDLDEAVAVLQRAAALAPNHQPTFLQLGLALLQQNRPSDAAQNLQHAVELKPDDPTAHLKLGQVLRVMGRTRESLTFLRRAAELKPGRNALMALGEALYFERDFDGAVTCFLQIVEIAPDSSEAYSSLGVVFQNQGRVEEAIAAFRKALALCPHDLRTYSDLLYTLWTTQALLPSEMLDVAHAFETAISAPSPSLPRRKIDRAVRTRVGIISAEVGEHAVSYFLESYLRHCSRDRIALTLYSTVPRIEPRHEMLMNLAENAVDLSGVADGDAYDQIVAADLDILIDTTSHMVGSRLPLLARRCAQIQCHYIGFSGTGLNAIDYFIGDDEVTPPAFEPQFAEHIVRLPRLWMAYAPPIDAPEPESMSPPDSITFGCFNNLAKVGEQTLAMWAEALCAVPTSRLILKDRMCADHYTRDRIIGFLAAHGIDAQRIRFIEYVPSWHEHMTLYNQIDIALDTLPLNSGTTGFDALYMATPLMALRGNCMSARMSSAMLKALGHPEWIAETTDDYRRIALALASDLGRLKGFKRTLRREMLNSPLCDGKSLASALEIVFEQMAETHNARP